METTDIIGICMTGFLCIATTAFVIAYIVDIRRKRRIRRLAEKILADQTLYSTPSLQRDAAKNALATAIWLDTMEHFGFKNYDADILDKL